MHHNFGWWLCGGWLDDSIEKWNFKKCLKRAERGEAKSQCELGEFYTNGKGVTKNDVEAVRWYRKSAEQGYAEAQIKLGDCFILGAGVVKDEAESVKWYRKAAEQGKAAAQIKLGDYYRFDTDAAQHDYLEAAKWYRRAAE